MNKIKTIVLLILAYCIFTPAPICTASTKEIIITNSDINVGFKADYSTDNYYILNSTLTVQDDYQINSNVIIENNPVNNAIISITKNNSTLDLKNQAIKTNKSGQIAIAIADNVEGVTIKNGYIVSGSENFDIAILVGQNCANITIENIAIRGTINSLGAIQFKGSVGQYHNLITIKDIKVYKSSTHAINISNTRSLLLDNIICCSNTLGEESSMIQIESSNHINIQNLTINNNNGSSGLTGIKLNNCKDILISDSLISNNDNDSFTQAVTYNNCKQATTCNVTINKLNKAKNGIEIINSQNINNHNLVICNCSSKVNDTFNAILINASQGIDINSCNISNNSSDQNLHAIKTVNATSKDLSITNTNIKINKSTSGNFTAIHLDNTELIHINNCEITRNQAKENIYGIYSNNTVVDLSCKKISCRANSSSTASANKQNIGIATIGTSGLTIDSCSVQKQKGAGQTVGFYLESIQGCEIVNSQAVLNSAATSIADSKPSAGFFLYKSCHCILKDCVALQNRGGNYAPGNGSSTINPLSACSGFGVANIGESSAKPSIGNQFIRCKFNGNGTRLSEDTLTSSHKSFAGGRRYWESQALAAGAVEHNSQQSHYKTCEFNNNGLSKYVFSSGIMVIRGSKNIIIENCTATNNSFYGFSDLNPQCETFIFSSMTLGNGSYNNVAKSVERSQEKRNANINYRNKKPFYIIKMDDFSSIDRSNSLIHNYNIIGRRNSNEDD